MYFFFFKQPATTEIYTLSLLEVMPSSFVISAVLFGFGLGLVTWLYRDVAKVPTAAEPRPTREKPSGRLATSFLFWATLRSEEHTSELQSRQYLVCRLLLEKKNMMLHST